MSTFALTSDLATDQNLALGDSSKLVKDGTRLTGNVQTAVARYTAAAVYATSDSLEIDCGLIPAGVRILPHLCAVTHSTGADFTLVLKETTNSNNILVGTETSAAGQLFTNFDEQRTATPTRIVLVLGLLAALPAGFVADVTIAYAAAA
jgi:hypothetical protein